jgi:SAM-dependent methyltransferase
MPTMMEIYQRHAVQYDELVDAEDHEGNLWRTLQGITDWRGRSVLEAGAGTGRVTALYAAEAGRVACLDGSAHMLDRARLRLARHAGKITFGEADNLSLPAPARPFDVFIEGWSFGHSVVAAAEAAPREAASTGGPDASGGSDASGGAALEAVVAALVDGAARCLAPGGVMILIETLGTCVESPGAPDPALARFYGLLETRHGFTRTVVRTDYRFTDAREAERICRFFFGDAMGDEVRRRGSPQAAQTGLPCIAGRPQAAQTGLPCIAGRLVVPEWTGVWHRSGVAEPEPERKERVR